MKEKTQIVDRLHWLYNHMLSEWVAKKDYAFTLSRLRHAVFGDDPKDVLPARLGRDKPQCLQEVSMIIQVVLLETRGQNPTIVFTRSLALIEELIDSLNERVHLRNKRSKKMETAKTVFEPPAEEEVETSSSLARLVAA